MRRATAATAEEIFDVQEFGYRCCERGGRCGEAETRADTAGTRKGATMAGDTMPALAFGARGEFLRSCVLLVLAEGDHHGYELAAEIADRGYGDPDHGGLYRALRAMEDHGLVTSSWELGDHGPARRMYAITDHELAALHDSASTARNALRRLDRVLSHYRRVRPARARAS